jgi:outer membrane protein assembly factor BamB
MRTCLSGLTIVLGMTAPVMADWPQFRGPDADGVVRAGPGLQPQSLPVKWSETENVVWKTPIPHQGWSTPVVMDGMVWLTTATLDGHDFFAIGLDQATGKIRHNKHLFHSDSPEPLGNKVNCYASPSPAIEPGRVYIHFGSYGTACLDSATGQVLWERKDLPCRHYRGPGSSVVLFKDFVILTMDGIDLQYLVALDKKTGKTVWKTDRSVDFNDLGPDGKPIAGGDYRKAYSTPLVTEVDGKPQLISAGAKAIYGYDPITGSEIWKVQHNGQGNAAMPVVGHGLAFVSTGFSTPEFLAIRLAGARGDVTKTNIVWRTKKGAPKMPSPILVDDLLFLLSDQGVVSCLEAQTGKELWKERISGDYAASMLEAAGRIYCFSQEGKATVLKAGHDYQLLAKNVLPSGFMASPAASGKSLYLRTRTDLYRIETAK